MRSRRDSSLFGLGDGHSSSPVDGVRPTLLLSLTRTRPMVRSSASSCLSTMMTSRILITAKRGEEELGGQRLRPCCRAMRVY